MPQEYRGARFGRDQLAREGTIHFYARQYWEQFVLHKTVLTFRSDTKMRLFLYLIPSMKNEFLLGKKYLSMKGVFSVENRIIDNVGMSLPSA